MTVLDEGTVRIVAGLVFALTAGALVLLGRSSAGVPRTPPRVVARREPARGTEALWLTGTLVVQVWSLGVLVRPGTFYAWPGVADFPDSSGLQVLGLALWGAGGFLALGAARALGRFMTAALQVREDHRLVQEGPYRWIRHPTYTANMTMALGLTLLFLSPFLVALAAILIALAAYRARLEEGLLRSPEGFGPAYESYMDRTGRFLPRFRSR